jgi:hypothetical protein
MKKIIVAVTAVLAMSFTAQAQAWGPREQGALAGIAGTLLFQAITQNQGVQVQGTGYPPVQVGGYPQNYPQPQVYQQQPQIIYQQPQIIYQQAPMQRVCDSFPQYDVYGRFHGQRTVCRSVPAF